MRLFKFLPLLFFPLSIYAQLNVTRSTNATELAQLLAGNGVIISNATLTSGPSSAGFFIGGNSTNLGVNNGVVLCSGSVIDTIDGFGVQAEGVANNVFANSASNGSGVSDADLDDLFTSIGSNSVSQDATILEFDILVLGDTLKFNYVFGSEEYTSFTCTGFTDIFGFLIDGPKPGGGTYVKQNIALIPGSNLPVAINTVNGGNSNGTATPCILTNTQYYVDNLGAAGQFISYDGFTTVLQAVIPTIPCTVYHLKLAIADANDQTLDSGVFLQGNSFVSTVVNIESGVLPGVFFDNAVEGCNSSGFTISINPALPDSFTLLYSLGGQATNGTDYPLVTGSELVFAPGDTLKQISINPTADGVFEGNESVVLYLINSCNGQAYDSAVIFIQDTVQLLTQSPDITICVGEQTQLLSDGAISFEWTPASTLSNPQIYNPIAFPLDTTTYMCVGTVGTCKDTSYITVNVQESGYTFDAGPNDTICKFGATPLQSLISGNQNPFTFVWSPSTGLNDSSVLQPIAGPLGTTTYQVLVTGANGCTLRDSVTVFVIGQAPLVQITADNNYVCPGDTINLNAQVFPLSCGLNTLGCTGNFGINLIGNGTNQFGTSPFNAGFSPATRTQILYRAPDLTAGGLAAGTITDIAFDLGAINYGGPYNDFTIRMGCTNENNLSQFVEGLSEVVNPYQLTLAGPGLNTFSLNNYYDWDGVSNLIIEICFSNTNGSFGQDNLATQTTNYNSVLQANSFGGGQPGCELTGGFPSTELPNIQFVWCEYTPPPLTYTWVPASEVSNPTILNPYVVLEQDQTVILNVSDSSCTGSGVIDLKVNQYGVSVGNDTIVCNGNSVQLNAQLYGNVPPSIANCGITTTPCNGTPVVNEIIDSTINIFGNSNTPFNSFFEDTRAQYLYKASDLSGAGFVSGTIQRIGWRIDQKISTLPYNNFTIKLSCTSTENLVQGIWENTQTVYTNNAYNSTIGWNSFTLQNPYNWDGTSNLIVEICFDNNQFEFGSDEVAGEAVAYQAVNYVQTDNEIGCTMQPGFFIDNFLPTLSLSICPAPPIIPNYSWSPNNGLNNSTIPNPIANPTSSTTYFVEAVFPDGCTKRDTITVAVSNFSYTNSVDTTICNGRETQLQVFNGATINWNPSTGLSCDTCFNPIANPSQTTAYYFTVADTVGCTLSDSIVVSVVDLSIAAWFNDTLVDQGTEVNLGVDANGGYGTFNYAWSPSTYLNGTNSASVLSTPLEDVLYQVMVTSGDCIDSTQVQVRVNIIESPVALPDAFSPNGDGKNDEFYPVSLPGSLATVKTFRVYNRWGQMVHDNAAKGWDGTFKGSDQALGAYQYFIVIQRPFKQDETLQGVVTLIR